MNMFVLIYCVAIGTIVGQLFLRLIDAAMRKLLHKNFNEKV